MALIAAAIVPSAVSAASCRLNDPVVLRNIEYRGIYDNAVTLRDGVYEGEPFVPGGASRPRVELLDMLPVLHDLDGDGIDDAAVLLAETSGGSGAFTYLAVVSCRDDRAVNVGTISLGDHVMIRSMAGREGAIVLEFVAAGPGEPLCCPTRKVRNTYRLRGGKLLLASSEEQGALSLSDVKGVTWRLSRLGRNERVPDDVKVTAVFGDGRISGSGGCNRYSAAVVETDPRGFSVGPAASTKMACPDPAGGFEDRYFSALQAANRFGFLLGNLVLHYDKEAEVYFRIVHVAQCGHNGASVAAHHEQTVEIALRPKDAFKNGNIGAMTRRVPGDKMVSAVLRKSLLPAIAESSVFPHVESFP